MNRLFWLDRRVLVTGHTGFKGSWLCSYLSFLGARVYGCALPVPAGPSAYETMGIAEVIEQSFMGDILDSDFLDNVFAESQPTVVFHLAAQSLVRESYQRPVQTFMTNIIGSANVVTAALKAGMVKSIVNITSDKCYANNEWFWPYRESDRLGGHDPYSASKAAAEIVSESLRDSFCRHHGLGLATARAGNVIGGGDWSSDRLIPDMIRAHESGRKLVLRCPESVRPWQHVLEPLTGYLILAEKLNASPIEYSNGWNFGPNETSHRSVRWVVEQVARQIDFDWEESSNLEQPHEAKLLALDSSRAKNILGWAPLWSIEQAVAQTVDWYQRLQGECNKMSEVTKNQIVDYVGAKFGAD